MSAAKGSGMAADQAAFMDRVDSYALSSMVTGLKRIRQRVDKKLLPRIVSLALSVDPTNPYTMEAANSHLLDEIGAAVESTTLEPGSSWLPPTRSDDVAFFHSAERRNVRKLAWNEYIESKHGPQSRDLERTMQAIVQRLPWGTADKRLLRSFPDILSLSASGPVYVEDCTLLEMLIQIHSKGRTAQWERLRLMIVIVATILYEQDAAVALIWVHDVFSGKDNPTRLPDYKHAWDRRDPEKDELFSVDSMHTLAALVVSSDIAHPPLMFWWVGQLVSKELLALVDLPSLCKQFTPYMSNEHAETLFGSAVLMSRKDIVAPSDLAGFLQHIRASHDNKDEITSEGGESREEETGDKEMEDATAPATAVEPNKMHPDSEERFPPNKYTEGLTFIYRHYRDVLMRFDDFAEQALPVHVAAVQDTSAAKYHDLVKDVTEEYAQLFIRPDNSVALDPDLGLTPDPFRKVKDWTFFHDAVNQLARKSAWEAYLNARGMSSQEVELKHRQFQTVVSQLDWVKKDTSRLGQKAQGTKAFALLETCTMFEVFIQIGSNEATDEWIELRKIIAVVAAILYGHHALVALVWVKDVLEQDSAPDKIKEWSHTEDTDYVTVHQHHVEIAMIMAARPFTMEQRFELLHLLSHPGSQRDTDTMDGIDTAKIEALIKGLRPKSTSLRDGFARHIAHAPAKATGGSGAENLLQKRARSSDEEKSVDKALVSDRASKKARTGLAAVFATVNEEMAASAPMVDTEGITYPDKDRLAGLHADFIALLKYYNLRPHNADDPDEVSSWRQSIDEVMQVALAAKLAPVKPKALTKKSAAATSATGSMPTADASAASAPAVQPARAPRTTLTSRKAESLRERYPNWKSLTNMLQASKPAMFKYEDRNRQQGESDEAYLARSVEHDKERQPVLRIQPQLTRAGEKVQFGLYATRRYNRGNFVTWYGGVRQDAAVARTEDKSHTLRVPETDDVFDGTVLAALITRPVWDPATDPNKYKKSIQERLRKRDFFPDKVEDPLSNDDQDRNQLRKGPWGYMANSSGTSKSAAINVKIKRFRLGPNKLQYPALVATRRIDAGDEVLWHYSNEDEKRSDFIELTIKK
jgi:hypothetical protein